jgi:hypothetical protein
MIVISHVVGGGSVWYDTYFLLTDTHSSTVPLCIDEWQFMTKELPLALSQ